MRKIVQVLFCSIICHSIGFSNSLNVNQCGNDVGKSVSNIQQEIEIGNCQKPPCRLRRGTSIPISYKFVSPIDSSTLTNRVFANIVGIPFPFVGTDGTDACKNLYKKDGLTPAECPLKKGETYFFKKQFEILKIYPMVPLIVHWGLEGDSAFVVCFEVPARITH